MLYSSVSQPVGRGQLLMGFRSSHFAKFYHKTVYYYYYFYTELGLIKYVDLKVKKDQNAYN